MAVQTIGYLKSRFENNDQPTQQDFIDLFDSLRHVQASIAAADVTGLAALINAAVAAINPGSGDADLQDVGDAASLVIRSGQGDPVAIGPTTATRLGLFLWSEKLKLGGIETGATADQTSSEIIALVTSAIGDARLSANALRDLEAVIDARIAANGGGGPTESIYTAVTQGVSGSASYVVPAENVAKDFVILPLAPGNVKIGTTVGGGELFDYDAPDTNVVLAETSIFQLTATPLYFTGQFEIRFIIADYA